MPTPTRPHKNPSSAGLTPGPITAPNANKWAANNWKTGPVTLFQALGIKADIQYPKLQAQMAAHAAASSTNPSSAQAKGNTGNVTAKGGKPSSANDASNMALGQRLAAGYGWGNGNQWTALNNIVMAESGWDNYAQNPGSTAYGIGQFLDSTWSTVGGVKTSNATAQIQYMLAYIQQRYKTPEAAWAFHLANGWY